MYLALKTLDFNYRLVNEPGVEQDNSPLFFISSTV